MENWYKEFGQRIKSADLSADFEPEKFERIDIIIEKIEKTNQNPLRDDIISRFDPLSEFGKILGKIFFAPDL